MAKERIDTLLVKRGICDSKTRAAAYVLEGRVSIAGKPVNKPGEKFDEAVAIDFKNPADEYVSRGAFKLMRALDEFKIGVEGLTCLDIGISTGGFTDLMLRRGAKLVVGVDVGTGVLHPKIKNDPRVRAFEQTHVAKFSLAAAGIAHVDIVTCDVSFISVLKFIDKIDEFTVTGSKAVILVKPQFEAEAREVKKGGVVMDPAIHRRILCDFIDRFAAIGFSFAGGTNTPKLKDCKNIEYLIFLIKHDKISSVSELEPRGSASIADGLVSSAFAEFGRTADIKGEVS